MIERVQKILRNSGGKTWVIISSENKDPYFKKIISPHTTITSVAIITQNSVDIITHSLDFENLVSLKKIANVHSYNSKNPLSEILIGVLNYLNISEICLNYTTMNDVLVDTLGHGMFTYFTSLIRDNIPKVNFNSAEFIIYALSDIKTENELYKMSIAAKRANQILRDAYKLIQVGMTELDLVDLVHDVTNKKPSYFEEENIILEEYSWEEESCPIALTGSSFLKGGHALSSNTKVEKGNTVYFDFGVKLTFKDGTSWSSDIQRTGYVLKDGETNPPKEIMNRFKVIVDSITLGIKSIKPNMKGFEVDNVVRNFIIEKGYPSYDHATGHAIGEFAHNPGTTLSSSKKGLSNLNTHENGVYTIEPRIPLHNGVSIEEMVVVKSNGKSYTLCERQTDIILIK